VFTLAVEVDCGFDMFEDDGIGGGAGRNDVANFDGFDTSGLGGAGAGGADVAEYGLSLRKPAGLL